MADRINQSILKKRINIRQMTDMMRLGKALGKTVFFFGGAGLGKSQKMREIADALFPNNKGNNLCDVRLSDKEPTDLSGAQVPTTKVINGNEVVRTVYATADFWPTDPDWEGIVFLDELPNAILATQQAAYQVILDHVVGTFSFPKGAVFAGAGNRDTDNGGTTEMPGPLINRMIICEVDYNLEVWLEDYAIPYMLHPVVIGYLKSAVHNFYTGDDPQRSTMVFASPRQWETVSGILYQKDKGLLSTEIAEVAIAGSVGEGMEAEILGYYERYTKLPSTEDVFSGEVKTFPIKKSDSDLIYLFSQSGISKIEKDVMSSLADQELIQRIGNFLTFMFNNYGKDNPDMIVALFTRVFRAPSGKTPLLTLNTKRGKLISLLRKSCPTVMDVVMMYMSRYGDIMEDFN